MSDILAFLALLKRIFLPTFASMEVKRTEKITFRCTALEKAALAEQALRCGQTTSEYCRNLSLGGQPKVIKNVVLDNILPGDIYAKARELHFVSDVQRVVLLVRVTSGNDISAYDVVSGLFPDKQKDFVFNISETDTVLVKEIKPDNNTRDMEKLAASIVDTLQGDHYIKAVVGIGTPIGNIKDLASSFKEAQIAMEVGKVFDTERHVITYDHLGIARLIYQLPTTLCEAFLREVFKQESIDSLDAETLFTIQRFFENNLNVSETSRGLFVHRNTLVYRLEKIKKLTGLDLREFDDAIVFKVALMVKKYLSNNPAKY